MMRAVLSCGSNMADRLALLRSVPAAVDAEDGLQLVAASPVYTTAPWGVTDQDEFLNATLVVDCAAGWDPEALLAFGQRLEQAAERVRERRWGPRTLDVDIVQVRRDGAEVTSADPHLTLPHPQAHRRAFVLVPWLDVEPDARLSGTAVTDLVGRLDAAELAGVRRSGDTLWPGAAPGGGER